MSNTVEFIINLNGNAHTGIAQLDKALGKFKVQAQSVPNLMERINSAAFKLNNIFQAVQNTVGKVVSVARVVNCFQNLCKFASETTLEYGKGKMILL